MVATDMGCAVQGREKRKTYGSYNVANIRRFRRDEHSFVSAILNMHLADRPMLSSSSSSIALPSGASHVHIPSEIGLEN